MFAIHHDRYVGWFGVLMIPTWADVINRANLGMEVMHERNAHNFPLDLANVESSPVING